MSSNWKCPHGYLFTGSEIDKYLKGIQLGGHWCTEAASQFASLLKSRSRTKRLSRPDLFMEIARLFGQRSSCPRADVGAVAVRDGRIIATGYVGAPAGQPHCDVVGCQMEAGHCVRTIHAEANLVAWAARVGTSLHGTEVYATHSPCRRCAQLIANAGIVHVVYETVYSDEDLVYLKSLDVLISQHMWRALERRS